VFHLKNVSLIDAVSEL